MAARATAALSGDDQFLLTDLVLAECVYVLESFYEVERPRVAELMRAAIAVPSVAVVDPPLLLRALEVYGSTESISRRPTSLPAQGDRGRGDPVVRSLSRPRGHHHADRAVARPPTKPPTPPQTRIAEPTSLIRPD